MPRFTWQTTISRNVDEVLCKIINCKEHLCAKYNSKGRFVEHAVIVAQLTNAAQPATVIKIAPEDLRERRANGTTSFTCAVNSEIKPRVVACADASHASIPHVLEEVLSRFILERVVPGGFSCLDESDLAKLRWKPALPDDLNQGV